MNNPLYSRTTTVTARLALGSLLALAALPALADAPPKRLSNDQRILIALNRLAFGPRPGDLEAVRKIGLRTWIDQQLAPEKIDDAVVEQKLATLPTLKMTAQEMFDGFKGDQMQIQQRLQAAAANPPNGAAAPGQPTGRPLIGAPAQGPQQPRTFVPGGAPQEQRPFAPRPGGSAAAGRPGEMADGPMMNPQMRMQQAGALPGLSSIAALGELNDSKLLRACESNRQLREVLVDFWSNHFNVDVKKAQVRAFKPIEDRDVIRPRVFGKFRDLLEASAKSPAMLLYLDNALSTRDFNDPKSAPPMRPGGQFRPGIGRPGFPGPGAGPGGFQPRPGGFAEPGGPRPQRPGQTAQPAGRRAGGLNENYARELLELHTLGVDGGYTQKDVQEVARCLTGWSLDRVTGEFKFFPFLHDFGEKTVLGHKIPAGGGIRDGEMVLDIVASHPSTARYLARKLCMRFVADTPPTSLVDSAADTFTKTQGDLREVVRTIVTSREFLSPSVYRGKMKSPFEYAVSAVRAIGAEFEMPDPLAVSGRLRLVTDGAVSMGRGPAGRPANALARSSIVQEIALMGQPLFSHEAPTGYPEDSREWVSSGSLLARFNFAQNLTTGKVGSVSVPLIGLPGGSAPKDQKAKLTALARAVLGDNVSESTRTAILHEMEGGADSARTVALLLGSPEFQRR
jgi:uncharacterized protein (DUF1800 family)